MPHGGSTEEAEGEKLHFHVKKKMPPVSLQGAMRLLRLAEEADAHSHESNRDHDRSDLTPEGINHREVGVEGRAVIRGGLRLRHGNGEECDEGGEQSFGLVHFLSSYAPGQARLLVVCVVIQ